ncbi:hypothetical protein [Methanobrevibacter sp.]|uniref:hypothetical protein n=1 Tax=Methanobrevibacter sp. TaxID=66852 RepID=UPI00388E3210
MMSFSDKYFKYVRGAFADHKYLFIFTVLFAVMCWIGAYFMADWLFTKQELVDGFSYLAQETFFSFDDMMEIIVNNCLLNIIYYFESMFFGFGAFEDMILNIGMSGIVSRATEIACGDPFLFLKLTCLHGFFEDLSTILNSFAGFILFSFIVRFIKDLFSPSKRLANGTITNSLEINKKHLYQSIAIFILAFAVMIFAGFLEEYISIPFGNLIASIF